MSGAERRPLGRSGLQVSAVGFGAWGIGGAAYGAVAEADAFSALAVAEELGCNFVDTAAVYADSEARLGQFLRGRRDRWVVASKYSKQAEGLVATVEGQLRRLGTEVIDLYQLHWAPGPGEETLYDQLDALRRAGKVRAVGVSLGTAGEIDRVLAAGRVDVVQVRCSLLDPEPLGSRLAALREAGVGVIARSVLRQGYLAGRTPGDAGGYVAGQDQRAAWASGEHARVAAQARAFGFLVQPGRTLLQAAARYPLSLDGVSCVLLGTKNAAQARENFGAVPVARLSPQEMAQVAQAQRKLGVGPPALWRRALRAVRRRLLP